MGTATIHFKNISSAAQAGIDNHNVLSEKETLNGVRVTLAQIDSIKEVGNDVQVTLRGTPVTYPCASIEQVKT